MKAATRIPVKRSSFTGSGLKRNISSNDLARAAALRNSQPVPAAASVSGTATPTYPGNADSIGSGSVCGDFDYLDAQLMSPRLPGSSRSRRNSLPYSSLAFSTTACDPVGSINGGSQERLASLLSKPLRRCKTELDLTPPEASTSCTSTSDLQSFESPAPARRAPRRGASQLLQAAAASLSNAASVAVRSFRQRSSTAGAAQGDAAGPAPSTTNPIVGAATAAASAASEAFKDKLRTYLDPLSEIPQMTSSEGAGQCAISKQLVKLAAKAAVDSHRVASLIETPLSSLEDYLADEGSERLMRAIKGPGRLSPSVTATNLSAKAAAHSASASPVCSQALASAVAQADAATALPGSSAVQAKAVPGNAPTTVSAAAGAGTVSTPGSSGAAAITGADADSEAAEHEKPEVGYLLQRKALSVALSCAISAAVTSATGSVAHIAMDHATAASSQPATEHTQQLQQQSPSSDAKRGMLAALASEAPSVRAVDAAAGGAADGGAGGAMGLAASAVTRVLRVQSRVQTLAEEALGVAGDLGGIELGGIELGGAAGMALNSGLELVYEALDNGKARARREAEEKAAGVASLQANGSGSGLDAAAAAAAAMLSPRQSNGNAMLEGSPAPAVLSA